MWHFGAAEAVAFAEAAFGVDVGQGACVGAGVRAASAEADTDAPVAGERAASGESSIALVGVTDGADATCTGRDADAAWLTAPAVISVPAVVGAAFAEVAGSRSATVAPIPTAASARKAVPAKR
jgi:hypothetical protein